MGGGGEQSNYGALTDSFPVTAHQSWKVYAGGSQETTLYAWAVCVTAS